MPTLDGSQPPPGPSPSPTPLPCMALKIVTISPYGTAGRKLLNFVAPFDSLIVSKDYCDKCSPVAGGYYCRNDDLKWFMSDADYAAKFPQN